MEPQNAISELYRLYYLLADDNEFRGKFDEMCGVLETSGEEPVDTSLLPALTRSCSNEELRRAFCWLRADVSHDRSWKEILAGIDQAMSSVTDLP